MKKTISMILIMSLLFYVGGCSTNNGESEDEIEQDEEVTDEAKGYELTKLNQTETISANQLWHNSSLLENLKLENGYLKLYDIDSNGIIETNDFTVASFSELVPTWNVIIDSSSSITIFVAIGNDDEYSEYYLMALWKQSYKTSFSNIEDDFGRVSIDTIIPKKDNINRVKFKIVLTKSETDITAFKNLSITMKLNTTTDNFNYSSLTSKTIDLSPRQQLSVPAIGNLICSPTSLSMVLNYYGHIESQADVSRSVYDQGAKIYGNWSFNASYAGGFIDLYSRVEYTKDLSELVSYIKEDKPVVLSIRTQKKDALEGSIMGYPSGHLLVLRGFKMIDDVWYELVSDPAEYEDSKVNREYKLDQLLEAWRGYIYVVQSTPF